MTLDFSAAFTERTPRIVNAAKLHRAATRRKMGKFLIEGENSVDAAVSTGAATDLFVTRDAAAVFSEILITAGYMGVYVHPITDKAAESLATTVTTTGIFAVCRPILWTLGQALKGSVSFVAVGVEMRDPGNAGTLIRMADALGAQAVIFAGDTVDPQSPKVVRASAGSLFHVPVVRAHNIAETIEQLRAKGLTLCATAMDGEVALNMADTWLNSPTAWLFGNEAHGLDPQVQASADLRVRIPLHGSAESLNVATAAAMCLWESSKAHHHSNE